MEFITFSKIVEFVKTSLTFSTAVKGLRLFLIFLSAGYFYPAVFKLENNNVDWAFIYQNKTELAKFLGLSVVIWYVFYKVIVFFLRLILHSWLRNKALKIRREVMELSSFQFLRFLIEINSTFGFRILKKVFDWGYLSSEDIKDPIMPTLEEKESFFNDTIVNFYLVISTCIHSICILCFIYGYYEWWLFVILLISLSVTLFIAYIQSLLIVNFDVLELIRKQLLRKNRVKWMGSIKDKNS